MEEFFDARRAYLRADFEMACMACSVEVSIHVSLCVTSGITLWISAMISILHRLGHLTRIASLMDTLVQVPHILASEEQGRVPVHQQNCTSRASVMWTWPPDTTSESERSKSQGCSQMTYVPLLQTEVDSKSLQAFSLLWVESLSNISTVVSIEESSSQSLL